MSDSEKRRSSTPKAPSPERFPAKVALFWLAGLAVLIALFSLTSPPKGSVLDIRIDEVVKATDSGRVTEGVIKSGANGPRDWSIVTGKMHKNPENPAEGIVEFRAEGRLTDDIFNKLQNSGIFKEQPASSLLLNILVGLVPFLVVIALLYFLFLRQIRMAGKGAMNFGKSKARMLTRDRERLTFDDVAGCDEAKEEIREVVEFLKDPKKFQKMGARIPKGILMVGPPGTGKTLLAKAVAGEADVPFFSISGSDFVEMFVGVGASRVRDMFEQGRKNAPCLIFIDEIDAVGRQRFAGLGGGNDEREQTLNSLLVEMDGFDTSEGVIIIAATNRPDVLDQALLRPGRFDRQIYIDNPDIVGREQILRVHSKKLPLAEDVDLQVVARSTPGFSGAELANLLNESALISARKNKKKIHSTDIEEARDKVMYGRERRRKMDDEDKKVVSYHEAGHALVQAVVDDGFLPVHKVTIIPRGRSLGSTMFIPSKDVLNYAKRRLLSQLAALMGGRAAEEVVIGDITSGAAGDIKQATDLARRMVCSWGMSPLGPIAYADNEDQVFLGRELAKTRVHSEVTAQAVDSEIRRLIEEQYARAIQIVRERRSALDKIAEALVEYETIEGRHVREILEFGEIRSPVSRDLPRVQPTAAERAAEKAASEPAKVPDLPPGAAPAHA
jgi:cell division protease FtsH